MTKTYKVLWIDDEFEKMEPFSDEAKANDIFLTGFKSYEEAFENFEHKIFEFDAILLDALFFKSKTQLTGSEDLKGLALAKDKIAEFRKQRNIPFFILSGQTKLDNNETFSDTYGEHYRKQNPDHVIRLFSDIKAASDKQVITQIRHKYQNVFDVCTDKYIGQDSAKTLLEALRFVDDEKETISTEDLFNPIRKIVEKLFAMCNNLGILPDEIFKGSGWINQSSIFLGGKNSAYKIHIEILSLLMSNTLESIVRIMQDASHSEGSLKLKVDRHVKSLQTPYLYKSVVFQLLDILVWFKKFADENPDSEKNKLFWTHIATTVASGDWIPGEITRIASNGFGTFQPSGGGSWLSIIPSKVTEFDLREKQHIEVITKPDSAGTKILIQEIRLK